MKFFRWKCVVLATCSYATTVCYTWALVHDLTTHREWNHNSGVDFCATVGVATFLAGSIFLVVALITTIATKEGES